MMVLERLRLEARSLWRRLTGAKRRARAQAMHQFDQALADLRPGDIAIDLGANLGLFTSRMAATGARVFAFEPDPHALSRLRATLAGQGNVTVIAAAAGVQDGSIRLFRHRDFDNNPDQRSTGSSIIEGKRHMREDQSVEVELRDFLRFLRELDAPVKLLKIDIEGAEVPLLEALLTRPEADRIDRIFVETHERVLPALAARTRALKALAATRTRPAINWDWH